MIPVSVGELFDKISILKIKELQITDDTKLKYITRELECLQKILDDSDVCDSVPAELVEDLMEVNIFLWDVINRMMVKENTMVFDDEYYELAKSVRSKNDERYDAKSKIDTASNSDIKEQKGYSNG
jgi:hypothetical protein